MFVYLEFVISTVLPTEALPIDLTSCFVSFLFASCKQLMTLIINANETLSNVNEKEFHSTPFLLSSTHSFRLLELCSTSGVKRLKSHKRLKIYCFNRIHSCSSSPFHKHFHS